VLSQALSETLEQDPDTSPADLINCQELRWAMRQDDSGTERLLEDLCSVHGQRVANLRVSTECNSERSAVAAVNMGAADITCGVQSTAFEFGLRYLPIADVVLDLVMSQKTYFRTLVQDFLGRIQTLETDQLPTRLDGYKINSTLNLVTLA
jgi:molybdate-binding protein